jgi:hypothetical protein
MAKPRGKPFTPGNKAAENRGANKITKTVKGTFLDVFLEMQTMPKVNLLEWGIENPRDFYGLATKLIPTELAGNVDAAMTIKVIRDDN